MSERETDPAADTADERRIVHEADIDAPLAVVWRALTTSALLAEWLGPNTLRAEVGRLFTVEIAKDGDEVSIADGEVLEVEPERRLRFSLMEQTFGDDPAEYRSVVEIVLTETPDGVRLRLVQDSFERVVPATTMVWAVAAQRVLPLRSTLNPRRPTSYAGQWTMVGEAMLWAA
jgi:uncharacterized protein YndB with AHSA1/START domain